MFQVRKLAANRDIKCEECDGKGETNANLFLLFGHRGKNSKILNSWEFQIKNVESFGYFKTNNVPKSRNRIISCVSTC